MITHSLTSLMELTLTDCSGSGVIEKGSIESRIGAPVTFRAGEGVESCVNENVNVEVEYGAFEGECGSESEDCRRGD